MANIDFFKDETKKTTQTKLKWKIIIADDEQDVHTLTKTVLKDFEYQGKRIEFISTYSEAETINALKEHNDVAMILLDVVMDSDDAGLKIAKRIREELKNNLIQIILRTGQAGSAPETDVVINYAINDYKEKTELTSKKLITTIITALRSYKTLKSVESNKKGLQQIIDASETLYTKSSSKLLSKGILTQILSLLKIDHDALLIEAPLKDLDQAVLDTQAAMEQASRVVLDGFAISSDVELVRYPDRYADPRGAEMWQTVLELLGKSEKEVA